MVKTITKVDTCVIYCFLVCWGLEVLREDVLDGD